MPSGADSFTRALWRWAPAVLPFGGLFLEPENHHGVWVALLIVAAGLMVARLEWPQATWWAMCGVAIALTCLRPSVFLPNEMAPLLPFAQIGTAGRTRRTLAYLAGSLLLTAVLTVGGARPSALFAFSEISTVAVFGMPVGVYGVVAAWSHGLGTRQAYNRVLIERAQRLEADQARQAELAVLTERSRIARDLHDVITHGVAVMVVQADAADAVWEANPARSRQAVQDVAETGRTVMTELRAMLDAMRDRGDGIDGAERAATVGLEGAGELVARLDRSGVAAALHVTGDLGAVAPAVSLAAERILRESLTNVLRHSRGAHANVEIIVGSDRVWLRVRDDGVGVAPDAEMGYGIRGMQERARLSGGELTVRAAEGGGTLVEASLPLEGVL